MYVNNFAVCYGLYPHFCADACVVARISCVIVFSSSFAGGVIVIVILSKCKRHKFETLVSDVTPFDVTKHAPYVG